MIDKGHLQKLTPFPVGQINCRRPPGYSLIYKIPDSVIPGLTISINPKNIIELSVNFDVTDPRDFTSDLVVTIKQFSGIKLVVKLHFQFGHYSLVWFKILDPLMMNILVNSEVLRQISNEINEGLQDSTDSQILQIRNGTWVDILLKSNSTSDLKSAEAILNNSISTGSLGQFSVKPDSFKTESQVSYIFDPLVELKSNVTKILENNTVKVDCVAEFINNLGRVDLIWLLNNNRLQSTSRFHIQTILRHDWKIESTLTIDSIKSANEGRLGCQVTDIYGFKKSSSRDLQVISPPIVEVDQPQTIFIPTRKEIQINCTMQSNGDDNSTIQWFVDKKLKQTDSTLTITPDSDTEIVCIGKNEAGQGQPKVIKIFIIPEGDKSCPNETDDKNTKWPKAAPGKTSILPCQKGYEGTVTRQCNENGDWIDPDYSKCIDTSLMNLQSQINQLKSGILVSTPDKIMQNMSAVTKQTKLNSGELVVIAEGLKDLTSVMEKTINDSSSQPEDVTNWAQEAVNLVGNLIEPKQSLQDVQIENKSVSLVLLDTMDDVSKIVGAALPVGEITTVNSDSVALTVGKLDPLHIQDVRYPDNNTNQTTSLSVDLPAEIFKSTNSTESMTFSIITYANLTSFPQDINQNISDESSSNTAFEINSDILAINVFSENFDKDNLKQDAVFTFSHHDSSLSSASCTYWNTISSVWDNKGCQVTETSQTSTSCSCDHLTNFALLMKSTSTSLKDREILSTITVIGATISIISLIITVSIYALVWRYVRSDRAILLVNLCIALIIALVLFLVGIEETGNKGVCTTIAVGLHYFYLVVFFLMLAEGVEVLITIVNLASSKSRLIELSLMGWGSPLIIVSITMGVTKLRGYGNSNFCWLEIDSGVIWSFIGPALFVILVNIIIIIKITYSLLNTKVMLNKDARTKAKAAIRSLCVLLPVMGVGWIFGILSVNEDLVVFDYIFTILNTLQGLFIFIFHCVINRKVKEGLANHKRRLISQYTFFSDLKSTSRSYIGKSRKSSSGGEMIEGTVLSQSYERKSRKSTIDEEMVEGIIVSEKIVEVKVESQNIENADDNGAGNGGDADTQIIHVECHEQKLERDKENSPES